MADAAAAALLRGLHDAQNRMYGGGDPRPVRDLLTNDVERHVPGRNAIAGDYLGVDVDRRSLPGAGRPYRPVLAITARPTDIRSCLELRVSRSHA
jgi:hypothetical protein